MAAFEVVPALAAMLSAKPPGAVQKGVRTGPGAMALTRTPRGANSSDSALVRLVRAIAHLEKARARAGGAEVVHEDVDPTMPIHRGLDEASWAIGLSEIDGDDGQAVPGAKRLELRRGRPATGNDAGAFTAERLGDGEANALAGARDYGNPVL
jgi:hypothetical protein